MDYLHSNPIANDIDHFKSQYVVIHTTSFWKVLDLNGWLQTADNRYFKPASICHFAWQSFDLACPSGRGLHELYIYIYIYIVQTYPLRQVRKYHAKKRWDHNTNTHASFAQTRTSPMTGHWPAAWECLVVQGSENLIEAFHDTSQQS